MARSDRLLRQHLRTRYLVTLTNGEAFDGVLIDHDEKHLVLVDAYQVAAAGRLQVDSDMWLPRTNVAYMQVTG